MNATSEESRFREVQARCRRLNVVLGRAKKDLELLLTREGELEGCHALEQELVNARKNHELAANGWTKGSVTRDEVREAQGRVAHLEGLKEENETLRSSLDGEISKAKDNIRRIVEDSREAEGALWLSVSKQEAALAVDSALPLLKRAYLARQEAQRSGLSVGRVSSLLEFVEMAFGEVGRVVVVDEGLVETLRSEFF